MSSIKEHLADMQEENNDRRLAEHLGITYDELSELNYRIDQNVSNDGLVYNYYIIFHDDSPDHILKKIKGIDKDNTVYINTSFFEAEEPDYD